MQITKLNNFLYQKPSEQKPHCARKFGVLSADTFEKTSQPNFTSRHIMDVNLKRRSTKKPIEAQVVKLDTSQEDAKLMLNLLSFWADSEYICSIADSYYNDKDFNIYAIASKNKKKLSTKDIKSLFVVKIENKKGLKVCDLEFLQSAPEIADNPKSSIRGSGEVALYYVVKLAKENDCDRVTVTSTNNSFYENMGFEMVAKKYPYSKITPFYLEKKDYDWFLDRVEDKYGF